MIPSFLASTTFPSIYEAFNDFECVAWLMIAAALPFKFRACPADKRRIVYRASVTFVVFAISDFLEAPTHALLPPWLWAWKILCVGYLLKCRYHFIGKENYRWIDRTNMVALGCLFGAILAIFIQYYFSDDILAGSQ